MSTKPSAPTPADLAALEAALAKAQDTTKLDRLPLADECLRTLPALLADRAAWQRERSELRRALAKMLVRLYDGSATHYKETMDAELLLTAEKTIAGREAALRAIAEGKE